MSYLQELVQELAPKGVESRSLGSVGEFIRGSGLRKSDLADEGVPAIHYGQVHTYYGAWTETTKSFTDSALASKLRRAKTGDLVIATTSEDDTSVAKATAWLGEGEVAVSGDAYIYRHTLDPRYVSYFFQSESFREQKSRYITGTKVRRVSGKSLAKIRIPVPPLEVQREIVIILDQFAELEAELKAELEARSQQRGALAINFAVAEREAKEEIGGPSKVRLCDVAKLKLERVKLAADSEYVNLGVKWRGEGVLVREPRLGREIKASTLNVARAGQLIYNRMFAVEGSFAIVPDECDGAVVSNEFPLFDIDTSRVDPRWLMNFFQDPYTLARIESEVTGVERGSMKARRRWKEDQFANFEIDLPPLSEQQRISGILEACDDLIASIEAEIAARRRQYEYYRERLLTFEEATE